MEKKSEDKVVATDYSQLQHNLLDRPHNCHSDNKTVKQEPLLHHQRRKESENQLVPDTFHDKKERRRKRNLFVIVANDVELTRWIVVVNKTVSYVMDDVVSDF